MASGTGILLVLLFGTMTALVYGGYVITMPKDVLKGRRTSICFNFYNNKNYTKVNLKFSNVKGTYLLERGTIGYARLKCLYFTIPKTQLGGPHKVSIIGDNRGHVLFDRTFEFKVRDDPQLIFIQTDKPAYNPGQMVRFRILTIDSNMKPNSNSISSILIKDPEALIMSQWLNVSSTSGLVSLEFQLSKEPVLGKWSIETEVGTAKKSVSFKIEEYVLPKFEVIISPPPYITIETDIIESEVCAKYTYGEPVKGRLKITVCIEAETPYWKEKRPCLYLFSEISGCAKLSINASKLELTNKKYIIEDAKVNITASVLDNATDILISKTSDSTLVSVMDLFLDIEKYSEAFYKPGLPYHIKIKVTDLNGKPASQKRIAVRAEELGFDKEFTTDESGFVKHTFPAMTANVTAITIKAIAVDLRYSKDNTMKYNLKIPGTSLVIEPWYSPTRSYMKITPLQNKVKCGTTVTLEVRVTQAPEESFRIYIMVVSRGLIHNLMERRIGKRSRFEDGCQDYTQMELSECIPRKSPLSRKYGRTKVESFLVDVDIREEMMPNAHVLVYFVHKYGEVVADYVDIDISVGRCNTNMVNVEFGVEEEYPGYETSLTIKAAPGSICGLSVIDKSVTLLGQVNSITYSQILKETDLFTIDVLDPWSAGYITTKDHCSAWLKQNEPARRLITSWSDKTDPKVEANADQSAQKVSIISSGWYPDDEDDYYYRVEHTDASIAFKATGILYLTDLTIDSRPCKEVWKKPYLFNDDDFSGEDTFDAPPSSPVNSKKKQVAVRDFFPETWLWNIETVGENGELVLKKKLPHTITQWIANAVCTNTETGVGISDDAVIKAFQPFFTSFNLPYSAIRGEFIPIKVTTFNYLSECVQIRLELKESEYIDIDPDIGSVSWQCICSNDAKIHTFVIVPKKIGDVNLTIVAEAVNGDDRCSGFAIGSDAVGVQDTVIRKLLVEPEGKEKEYTYGTLVCPEESPDGQYRSLVDLPIPKVHVPDSARGFVSVIGDMMGPSLNSATDLLRLPYGCGEQNMLVFAPNVFIMKYTKSSGQQESIDGESLKKFLVAGYQRELRYRRTDNSFSAFGNSDSQGSTWLTTFVAKTFHKAAEFIYVDRQIINKAWDFVLRNRNSDGCFRSVGRVIHSGMRGGLDKSDSDLLTVYVAVGLLESEYDRTSDRLTNAIECLKSKSVNSSYGIVLYTYLAAMYEPGGDWHRSLVGKLESRAKTEVGVMYWKDEDSSSQSTGYGRTPYTQASAISIETTAYALLSYLADPNPNFTTMLKIVRWLSQQQNPNGGFKSTQDTVIGLQALAAYATKMFSKSPSLSIFVDTFDYAKNFDINSTNSLVQYMTPIIAFPTSITVFAKGVGCGVLQATVRYNVIENRGKVEDFELNVTVNPWTCKRRSLNICTRFLGISTGSNTYANGTSSSKNPESNMAIVFAKMPTGWLADMDTVDKLQQRTTLFLKRTEVDVNRPDVINFYFDKLTKDKVCFSFDMVQETEVKNLKPAYVSVYDYYDPDVRVVDFYEISPDCERKKSNTSKIIKSQKDTSKDTRSPTEKVFYLVPDNSLRETNLRNFTMILEPEVLISNTTIKPPVNCPVCEDLPLKTFVLKLCNSAVAYATMSLRRNKLRLLTDMRASNKTVVDVLVTFEMPSGCQCHLNSMKPKSKLLIMMADDNLSKIKKTGKLKLDNKSTVVVLSRTIRKSVRAAKYSTYCRQQNKPLKKKTATG